MMTQTHSLVAATLLASPKYSVRYNAAILLGSLVPDVAIFGLFFWSKLNGISEHDLWQNIYFTEPMLTLTAIGNSFPLYCFVFFIFFCVALIKHKSDSTLSSHSLSNQSFSILDKLNSLGRFVCLEVIASSAMALFALAAITHLLGDFPVHANDAHPHFWPITDWRFESPVSYWNHNHYGDLFSIFETALGVILSIVIFRRFKSVTVRALTGLALVSYLAVPLYFSIAN